MRKSKILFVVESLKIGGAEKALVSILSNLDCEKNDISLLLISESGDLVKAAEQISDLKIKSLVKPTDSKLKSYINALKVKTIYKWLPERIVGNFICKGYDAVIAFCEGYLTKWVGASTMPCKKIAWVHTDMVNNDWPLKTGVFNSLKEEQKSYSKFDKIVTVSKAVEKGFQERFHTDKTVTIYNLIDSEIEQKAKEPTAINIPKRSFHIVSVGRLEKVKGYDLLIKAVSKLIKEQNLDISLCIVGDGSQKSYLQSLIDDNQMDGYISLAGKQINPYPFISEADIYICSSLREGFNIAILEAMILGKPIIATDSTGPRELLENDKFGLLVNNNFEGIYGGVLNLYEKTDRIPHYQRLSKERSTFFSQDTQIKKIQDLLRL